MTSSLFNVWNADNIVLWEEHQKAGLKVFIWKFGVLRFFPTFYISSLFGFYLMYSVQNLDFTQFWKPALIMFITGIVASLVMGKSLWDGTMKSYNKHCLK